MPKDFSKLEIGIPKFDDREQFLKTLGTIVVDGIVAMIEREEQPDGSPQKQNSPRYAEAKRRLKGYTTPLWGIEGGAVKLAGGKERASKSKKGIRGKTSGIVSPYLARRSTFLRDFHSPDKLIIHLNSKRAEIGVKLQKAGYWFMGITSRAEYWVKDRTYKYLRNHLRKMKKAE